jgi:uncharacterized membrane protein
MRKLLSGFLLLLIIAYPLAIYFGMAHISPRFLALAIGFVFLVRLLFLANHNNKVCQRSALVLALSGVILCAIAALLDSGLVMLFYPVLMNLLMLGFFGYSLVNPPTVIERLARLIEKDFPKEAIAYTRSVTAAWCVFFMVNASVALWTALFCSRATWAVYNGLIAYLLMGLLFSVEWLIRRQVKKKHRLMQRCS